MRKEENHMFQGMNRGSHQIRQGKEFLWDAHNIRLTDRGNSTLFSITNEKGTSDVELTVGGYYVGHCIIGDYLVIFTSEEEGDLDEPSFHSIYRIKLTENGYETVLLYDNSSREGAWSCKNPIEAVGVYETSLIQKVYWVDGVNQPRVINIAKPELKIPEKYHNIIKDINLSGPRYHINDEINEDITNAIGTEGLYPEGSFDFVRELKFDEKVTVVKNYGTGMFSAGTIQYALSYYSKYEQESNIWHVTPLYYISPKDRGGKASEKIANSFTLTINNPDTTFTHVRIYSIHRTSLDSTPEIKVVEDVPIKKDKVIFVDSGTKGYTIDSTRLLYVGGKALVSSSIAVKDNTLFLANTVVKNNRVFVEINNKLKEFISDHEVEYVNISRNSGTNLEKGKFYGYTPALSEEYSARFKTNEYYRTGLQVQYKDGTWLDPVWLKDTVLSTTYPWESEYKTGMITLTTEEYRALYDLGVRNIRACVVFPEPYERDVICQGVVSPTVFWLQGRRDDNIYAMSSWFFRPYSKYYYLNNAPSTISKYGSFIQNTHNNFLYAGGSPGAELQNSLQLDAEDVQYTEFKDELSLITSDNVDKYAMNFGVDENIVTLNSPELEFDSNISNQLWEGYSLRIVGIAMLESVFGDMSILSSVPSNNNAAGVLPMTQGFPYKGNAYNNGGLVSTPSYEDSVITVNSTDNYENGEIKIWKVYPWHRTGSLNNDMPRPQGEGIKGGVYDKKIISNLKFFNTTHSIEVEPLGIQTPKLFNYDETTLLKLPVSYFDREVNYMGNMDTLVTSGSEKSRYPFYTKEQGDRVNTVEFTEYNDNIITGDSSIDYDSSLDPVRLKYKSSPHLVFSLGKAHDSIQLLPRNKIDNVDNPLEEIWYNTRDNYKFTIPNWQGTSIGANIDKNPSISGTVCVVKEGGAATLKQMFSTEELSEMIQNNENYILHIYEPAINEWSLTKFEFESKDGVINPNKVVELEVRSSLKTQFVYKVKNGFKWVTSGSYTKPYVYPLPGTQISDYAISESNSWVATYTKGDLYVKLTHVEDKKNPNKATFRYRLENITYMYNDSESIENPDSTNSREEKTIIRDTFTVDNINYYEPYVLIGELFRDPNLNTKFGGQSDSAKEQNLWLPASPSYKIGDWEVDDYGEDWPEILFLYGDTWYSRYDCLKTYPFTPEDENQVIEVGSFMCETRMNIDGRNDINRGKLSNLTTTPQNFNLFSDIYSQKDNYYNYRIYNEDFDKYTEFNSQLTWSMQKSSGEETDTFTNIIPANSYDLGKSPITGLVTWNNNLLCFQEQSVSTIQFNSRVEIPTSDGLPIEISNSMKLTGHTPVSDTVGCTDRNSICIGDTGVYFIDSITGNIHLFTSEGLSNLSQVKGMTWWLKSNKFNNKWNPLNYGEGKKNGIRLFHDNIFNDIYLTPGPEDIQSDALCYSESLKQFTSFMSYGGTIAMFNFKDNFLSLRNGTINGGRPAVKLYKNNVGDYNSFYGEIKPWSFSFISNDNPTYTKIFDSVELRSEHFDSKGNLNYNCPISHIQVDDDYQGAVANISSTYSGNSRTKLRYMMNKFRIWRGLLPRHGRERIRNPWTKITLSNNSPGNNEAIIHDVTVKYSI